MPELPEVHTTVEGLKKTAVGKTITEVWSDFHIGTTQGKGENIKNERYYKQFKKLLEGTQIMSAERLGKNILLHLSNSHTLIVHMKMTGHLMVGKYKKIPPPAPSLKRRVRAGRFESTWQPLEAGPLEDPHNRYIHLALALSDGNHLVLSDMRKFASVAIYKTQELHLHERVGHLGPDPLRPSFTYKKFFSMLQRKKNLPVKSALMDQTSIAGIGNIYSDEILWLSGVHPLSASSKIPLAKAREMHMAAKKILRFSIKHGGDSKSDYRNIFGQKGGFQDFHKAYGKRGQACPKPGCKGKIERIMVKGRSSHYCPVHQVLYN